MLSPGQQDWLYVRANAAVTRNTYMDTGNEIRANNPENFKKMAFITFYRLRQQKLLQTQVCSS